MGKRHCRACLDEKAHEAKIRRERLIEAGLCYLCGKNPRAPRSRAACEPCLALARERQHDLVVTAREQRQAERWGAERHQDQAGGP